MDYLRQYQSFVNSHYLSQGVRITAGIALPALVFSYFHELPQGIVVSLGSMCVSMTDNPGPIRHRRSGMWASCLVIFLVALLTGLISGFPFALGLLVFLCCFIFSMIGVYGNRASSVGVSALLVMVLSINHPSRGWETLYNGLYILGGGIWYTVLSLLLYSFRPFKLAQQALGECMQSTAAYLTTKADFYLDRPDYDKIYEKLVGQQAELHQQQDLVRELLFRSRDLVKESTPGSRILVMIFVDLVDLFESVMASNQDYPTLHQFFDGEDLLSRFRNLLLALANELDKIGLRIKIGKSSAESGLMNLEIGQLDKYFSDYRDKNRNASNVEGFIVLRQILDNLHDLADRLHSLHGYTVYDFKLDKEVQGTAGMELFINRQQSGPQLLLENFNLKSNIFRHSIRVSVATLAGFIISKFLPLGHSYWILLTIIVILKPAYGLTKKRNYERLLGTIGGALVGILILLLFKNNTVLLAFMLLLMIGAYSFLRTKYLIGVLFMTPYVLLLFHLLAPQGFRDLVTDRLLDTGIGSGIAFLANFFIMPVWEHVQMLDFMTRMLQDNKQYFSEISGIFSGHTADPASYKLSRKKAFVSLANLSEAFNRMLSEPKSKQSNTRDIHQFVVLNHLLTSHIATLSFYAKKEISKYRAEEYLPVARSLEERLNLSLSALKGQVPGGTSRPSREELRSLQNQVGILMEKRKAELRKGITQSETRIALSQLKPVVDQFNFIARIVQDLEKLCQSLIQKSSII
jgi:uncharacterized membrane protein (TIGR01666 family)